jgi:hypothetical protein
MMLSESIAWRVPNRPPRIAGAHQTGAQLQQVSLKNRRGQMSRSVIVNPTRASVSRHALPAGSAA